MGNFASAESVRFGTTFSPLQCYYLGLDYRIAFREVCALGLDVVRLCGYWHEIEPEPDQFSFSTLDWLLDASHAAGQSVVLTVGMKAPRWPEYHFPDWLRERYDTTITDRPVDANRLLADHTLRLVEKTVNHTRTAPCLNYWQVENEPAIRQPITAGRYLSQEFVEREVALVRRFSLPHQKVILTTAIGMPLAASPYDERAFHHSAGLADAIGVNVYTRIGLGLGLYLQPSCLYWQRLQHWQHCLRESGKEAWIAEAQAEPWERKKLVAIDQASYPSAAPVRTEQLAWRLNQLGYTTILLWGCEYWVWQRQQGRYDWWQMVQRLVDRSQTTPLP